MLDARLVGFDSDAEMLLDEDDELESTDGIEYAPCNKGRAVGELTRVLTGKKFAGRMNCSTTFVISSIMASGGSSIQDEMRENRTSAGKSIGIR